MANACEGSKQAPRERSQTLCLCPRQLRIPRPRNAFMLYRQHQATVALGQPPLPTPAISKLIAERWNALPSDTKQKWIAMAQTEKSRHQERYPGYRYQPRRGKRATAGPSVPCKELDGDLPESVWCDRCGGQRLGRVVSPPSSLRSEAGCPPARPPSGLEAPHEARITLPPLQWGWPPQGERLDWVASPVAMSLLQKVALLARFSPGRYLGSAGRPSHIPGAVIAVEGTDPWLVGVIIEYLGRCLADDGRFIVGVFPGPEPVSRAVPCSVEEAIRRTAAEYFHQVAIWCQISDQIVSFIRDWSLPGAVNRSVHLPAVACREPGERPEQCQRAGFVSSPASGLLIAPDGGRPSASPTPRERCGPSGLLTGLGHPGGSGSRCIPVVLVPRYQLTTAEAFAYATPMRAGESVREHWHAMAVPWQTCVGPDITVCIDDRTAEDMERHGEENPVAVHLDDAPTIVVQRNRDSAPGLEAKALRRVVFELQGCLVHRSPGTQ